MLEDDFKFFVDHQDELAREYVGQYLIIKDKQVVGHYPSFENAYHRGVEQYGLGNFLIQECQLGKGCYTAYVGATNY